MIEFNPNRGWQAEARKIDQEMQSEFNEDADKAKIVGEIKEILHLLFDNSDDFRAKRLGAERNFWTSTPYDKVKNLDCNLSGIVNVEHDWQKKLDNLLYSLSHKYGITPIELTNPLLALEEEELRWLRLFYNREERKPEGGTFYEDERAEWSKAPLFKLNPNKGWEEEVSKIEAEEEGKKVDKEKAEDDIRRIQNRLRLIFGNESMDLEKQVEVFKSYCVNFGCTPLDKRSKKSAFERWFFQINRAISGVGFSRSSLEKVYGPIPRSIENWPLLTDQEKTWLREVIESNYNFEDGKIGQLIGEYWKAN